MISSDAYLEAEYANELLPGVKRLSLPSTPTPYRSFLVSVSGLIQIGFDHRPTMTHIRFGASDFELERIQHFKR